MKTKDIFTRVLVPAVICAIATLSSASSTTRQPDESELQNRLAGITVAKAPLVLSDFDRSAALKSVAANPAADASLDSSSVVASLVGPERISLPRAGGTTSITLQVQGLSLAVRPVTLPSGITVSVSGNQLTLVSTANRTGLERAGSIAITAQSPANARGGRVRGILISGVSQLPCTASTCAASGAATPTNTTVAPLPARIVGIDWSAVASSMRGRSGADAILIAIEGNDSPNRTSGSSITRLAQLCAANGFKCILELSSQRSPAASNSSPSAYFLSPDIHAALYQAEDHLILSLRGDVRLDGKLGAINQVRAAGLAHTLLTSSAEQADRILTSDTHRNTLFAVDRALAATSSEGSRVPTIVVPQAVITTAPLVPVDFEINGQAFVVDRSLVAFDAAGGSVSLRFLQTGGLRWAIRKVPNSFVAGGTNFPQSGNVTLTVEPSTFSRAEHIEFSAKSANGVVTMFIDVVVIQDATRMIF